MTRGPRPAIGIFARAPVPGRAKTRLAASIGAVGAAQLARAMLLDTADAVARDRRWRTVLFVEPGSAAAAVGALARIAEARPQAAGSIGARMSAAAEALLADGFRPIVLVGSDIPALHAAHIHAALDALADADVVFGPAADGGYYLLGLHTIHADLFADGVIPWGAAGVLAASEAAADRAGLQRRRIRAERDMDTIDDLLAFATSRRTLPPAVARRTRAALTNVWDGGARPRAWAPMGMG